MRKRLILGLAGLAATLGVSAAAPPMLRAEQPAPAALDPAEAARVVERVATTVETRYVDPATGRRYAAAIRARAADYARLRTARELGERITADLQAVHADGHLRVVVPRTGAAPGGSGPARTADPAPAELAPGIVEARWLAGRIAYIRFRGFSDDPAAVATLTRFLAEHRDARALVIDSRENGGGTFSALGIFGDALFARERPLVAMDLAETVAATYGMPFPIGPELRETPGPAGLKRVVHWAVPARAAAPLGRMPVYYLTSHRTYSAAEHLAFVLKLTGRATLVGETTGGGNHFGGLEPVGAGLELFVPSGRTSDPTTGRDWERIGVAPDVAVPADRALAEALRRIDRQP